MSTGTDKIFAAGLYSMLSGVKSDMDRDEATQAELTRKEGLERLNQKIQQENAPSGYVMKDTGKPIPQSQLESVPIDQRVTQADYALGNMKKSYNVERDMTKPARDEARQIQLEDRDAAQKLAETKLQEQRKYEAQKEAERRKWELEKLGMKPDSKAMPEKDKFEQRQALMDEYNLIKESWDDGSKWYLPKSLESRKELPTFEEYAKEKLGDDYNIIFGKSRGKRDEEEPKGKKTAAEEFALRALGGNKGGR